MGSLKVILCLAGFPLPSTNVSLTPLELDWRVRGLPSPVGENSAGRTRFVGRSGADGGTIRPDADTGVIGGAAPSDAALGGGGGRGRCRGGGGAMIGGERTG